MSGTLTPVNYSPRTIDRAQRALRCSPFRLGLFQAMVRDGIWLGQIIGTAGFEAGYSQKPLLEWVVERDLRWLIAVGLLRREVDGQGITDRFRLTPLGREVLETWENLGGTWPAVTVGDYLGNCFDRTWRIPI